MTILGKLLVFFNLLAAGGFVYLATQDWAGRQNINAAGLRHILVVRGLPLGDEKGDPTDMPTDPEAEIPFRMTMAGGHQTTTVSKGVLDAYIKNAPGNPADSAARERVFGSAASLGDSKAVPNQLAEVKRVKAKIDSLLTEAAEKPDIKLNLRGYWWENQPQTFDEREAVQRLIAAKDVAKLQEWLDARFAAVLSPPQKIDHDAHEKALAQAAALRQEIEDMRAATRPAAEIDAKQKEYDASLVRAMAAVPPSDETDRRNRVAHLLVHLDQDAEWQKRVALVVGLNRFALTIVNQSRRFLEMAERARLAIPVDQESYLSQERTLLRLAIARTDLANRQADLKAKWIDQEKKEADFVGQRETQLKSLQARLAKIKDDVDEMLARQTNIEAALFEVQREVAVTLDEVYRLEAVLEARERELLKTVK